MGETTRGPSGPLSPGAIQRHRESINVSKVLQRLEGHTLGTLVDREGKPTEMSKTQIAAAKILLDRVLPSLRSMELSAAPGTAGGFVMFGVPEAKSTEAWLSEHGKGEG